MITASDQASERHKADTTKQTQREEETMSSQHNASMSRNSGAIAIGDESLTALRALLQNEVHPLYACGRTYLSNLTKWRDHLLTSEENDLLSAEAAAAAAAAVASVGRAMTPRGETTLSSVTPTSRAVSAVTPSSRSNDDSIRALLYGNVDKKNPVYHRLKPVRPTRPSKIPLVASPDQDPNILLHWRARIVAWFYNFVEHMDFEFNTALVALSYLDAYSMSVCFPEEFSRIMGKSYHDEDTSLAPSPPKKRKTNHQHEDYLWEYVENCRQQQAKHFWEETVQGIDEAQYKLAALSSFYLATKIHQSVPITFSSRDFSNACNRRFSPKQIETMELTILNVLEFRVHPPTTLRFIQEMLPILMSCGGDNSFALDSSPWVPQNDLQKSISEDADFLVGLASYSDAAKFPPIISASPSKIALAAIVQAASRIFFKEKLLVQQHSFHGRLFSLQDVLYDEEVRTIQQCLVDLKRLNYQKKDSSREGSPATVTEFAVEAAKDSTKSPCTLEGKENLPVVSRNKLDKCAHPVAVIQRAVNQSSASRSKKRSRHCSGGRTHRMWERANQCALAATAVRRSYEHFTVEIL